MRVFASRMRVFAAAKHGRACSYLGRLSWLDVRPAAADGAVLTEAGAARWRGRLW